MQFDSEIKKIEDEFIDFIVSSPLFIGEKLIFSTIKAYFMTRENLTQEELKELSGFSSGAISQELKKLLKRGLIEISNISNTGKMTYSMKSINAALLNFYLSQFEETAKWEATLQEIKVDLDENKDEFKNVNGYDSIYRWTTIFLFSMPLTKMIFNLMEEEVKALGKKRD